MAYGVQVRYGNSLAADGVVGDVDQGYVLGTTGLK